MHGKNAMFRNCLFIFLTISGSLHLWAAEIPVKLDVGQVLMALDHEVHLVKMAVTYANKKNVYIYSEGVDALCGAVLRASLHVGAEKVCDNGKKIDGLVTEKDFNDAIELASKSSNPQTQRALVPWHLFLKNHNQIASQVYEQYQKTGEIDDELKIRIMNDLFRIKHESFHGLPIEVQNFYLQVSLKIVNDLGLLSCHTSKEVMQTILALTNSDKEHAFEVNIKEYMKLPKTTDFSCEIIKVGMEDSCAQYDMHSFDPYAQFLEKKRPCVDDEKDSGHKRQRRN